MIDLSGTQPSWPDELRQEWAGCVARAAVADALWRVPAPAGDEVLRDYLGRRFGMDPARVTIVASVRAAALTYARRHDRFILEQPTYQGIPAVVAGHQTALETRPWEQLCAGPAGPGDALWLTSPGRNPDGRTLTAAETASLARLASGGATVVLNASYAWYAGGLTRVPGADLVGSLHKLAGVGARIAWLHSATYFDTAVPELLGTTPSRIWQRAWGWFLTEGGAELLDDLLITPTNLACVRFRRRLTELGHQTEHPFDGPNTIIPLPSDTTEDAALAALAGQGFSVSAGRHFGCREPAVRATFAGITEDQAAAFADALVQCRLVAATRPLERER